MLPELLGGNGVIVITVTELKTPVLSDLDLWRLSLVHGTPFLTVKHS